VSRQNRKAARQVELCRLAYHEAGHAVVAYLLNYKPRLVTIRAFQDTDGRVELRQIGPHQPKRRHIEHRFMVSLAGPLAEVKQYPGQPDEQTQASWWSDCTDHSPALKRLNLSAEELERFIREIGRRTMQLLEANWHKVDLVAKMLLELRRLNRRQMIEIMTDTAGPSP
jgi:ATP-dependent Zn protease